MYVEKPTPLVGPPINSASGETIEDPLAGPRPTIVNAVRLSVPLPVTTTLPPVWVSARRKAAWARAGEGGEQKQGGSGEDATTKATKTYFHRQRSVGSAVL